MSYDTVSSGFLWTATYFNPDGSLGWEETRHNMIPTEGLNHIANVTFKGSPPSANWYIAPYEGNYTPVASETAATVAASTTESVAYDETTRQPFVSGTVNTGALDNGASKAVFTFNAAKTIYGGFLVSSQSKAGTTGVLMSLIRFSSPKITDAGGVLRIVAGIAFTSA